jgi:hypothetical protein
MKTIIKSIFVLSIVGWGTLNAMEQTGKILKIKDSSVFSGSNIGKIDLYYTDQGFYVIKDNVEHLVDKHSIDTLLSSLKHKQIKKFQKIGYIQVKQSKDNQFSLHAKTRGLGGGPIFGSIVYWTVKSLCYGTAVAATGAVVVGTGGAAIAAGGVIGGAATVVGIGAAASTPAVLAVGMGVTAGSIGAAGAGSTAILATTAVVTSAGSVAATVGAIEGLALAAGLLAGMIPTP